MEKLAADSLIGVSETLLIPLHYRAQHSKAADTAFKDVMAECFHDGIDYDWAAFRGGAQRIGIAARTEILDTQVKTFIAANPAGLIVNLGCGLDTRFYRLDNGSLTWIDIDLPAVIALRAQLAEPSSARHRLLARSVLEKDWIEEIAPHAGRPVLLVAEGLFPYFTEQQHKLVLRYLATHFPGQQMLFQTSAPSVVRQLVHASDLVKLKTSAQLEWGLEEGAQVTALDPRVQFVAEFSLLQGREQELPPDLRQKLSPDQLRRAAKIVHVRFE
jgi:O-methyltransferase involved in polyketide biosynthesis